MPSGSAGAWRPAGVDGDVADLGGEAVAVGPHEFKAHIGRELKLWGDTIREAKISLE
jgi:hypothetical protein